MNTEIKPNIVFIFPDQWRGDCFGHLGHPDAHTPWTDQLASEGQSFTRAFTPAPSCIPARMALMTGMSPWLNGRTGYEEGVDWTPPHTLPGLLRDHQYQTIQIGKTHFHPMRAHLGFEINDAYEASVREPGYISDYHRELQRAHPLVEDAALRRHPNAWEVTPWTCEREWHCSEWISTRAIERIQQRDPQRPFFMQIAYHRPHPPFDPPIDIWNAWSHKHVEAAQIGSWVSDRPEHHGAHAGLSCKLNATDTERARRGYYASIQHVDEQIGRVQWALRQQGLLDNTWIIVSSDHGECLGDHHHWHKAQPLAACARIPFIIRPPDNLKTERGILNKRPTLLQDLVPSILDWADVPIPQSCDAQHIYQSNPEWVHAEHHSHHLGWHALYSEQWAYHWHSDGTERLFNHDNDPHELKNIADIETDISKQCRSILIKRLHERGCGSSDGKQLILNHTIGPTQGNR